MNSLSLVGEVGIVRADSLIVASWNPDPNSCSPIEPKFGAAYSVRGAAYFKKKDYARAAADLDEGLELEPDGDLLASPGYIVEENFEYANACKAWLLATCPVEKYRDGKKAVEFAHKAIANHQNPRREFLEVLAAAHAEAGDFTEAVRWQERALQDSISAQEPGDAARRRLELYRNKQPYREE